MLTLMLPLNYIAVPWLNVSLQYRQLDGSCYNPPIKCIKYSTKSLNGTINLEITHQNNLPTEVHSKRADCGSNLMAKLHYTGNC